MYGEVRIIKERVFTLIRLLHNQCWRIQAGRKNESAAMLFARIQQTVCHHHHSLRLRLKMFQELDFYDNGSCYLVLSSSMDSLGEESAMIARSSIDR